MAFSNLFERKLDKMFLQRTHWLRKELSSTQAGKPPKFSRQNVDSGIDELQEIASKALAQKLAKKEFDNHVTTRKNYQVKGRGFEDKKNKFKKWFEVEFPKIKSLIYAFWGEWEEVYVCRSHRTSWQPSFIAF